VTRVVQAAGGLVFRRTAKGNLRILAVHRPKYDDWGLPKGKADEGERPEQTALREVLEETGYRCRVVEDLGVTRYPVEEGLKEVHWYAMRPLPHSPGFMENEEIDEICWLPPKGARKLLDYETERDLIDGPRLKKLARTGALLLLRHGEAVDRSEWDGPEAERPLTKKGRRQAQAVADSLIGAEVERVVASPYRRCVQSVKPLAAAIGAEVESASALAEEADIDAAYAFIGGLSGANVVISTHGDVIAAVVNRMMRAGLSLESPFNCAVSSIWLVEVGAGRFTTGSYLPPPELE